jgi:hypothetical protein
MIMNIETRLCDDSLIELAAALRAHSPVALPPAVRRHVSACSLCRATLLLLLAANDTLPGWGRPPIDCRQCLVDLAAFVELERSRSAAAAQAFPQIWWHLWVCAGCAETYLLTQRLLDADRARQPAARPGMPLPPMRLSRSLLRLALPQCAGTPAQMRGGEAQHVLFDSPVAAQQRYQLTIIAEDLGHGVWQIQIGVQPPVAGFAVLACGGIALRARFDSAGLARLDKLASELLLTDDGPDLELRFEPPMAG